MNELAERLAKTHVHIAGMGRIGTNVALALHAAGVGEISCNDPQRFEREQLQDCVFSRSSDVGRPKVYVLERFFDGRHAFGFTPIVAPNESPEITTYLERADLIVSCANQLNARLHLERTAVVLRKPCLQASASDGRQALAGLISIWAPESDCSCFGCLLPNKKPQYERGELLLPTVTRTIADHAAHLVVQMLGQGPAEFARQHNLFGLELQNHSFEALSVKRRPGCRVCGPFSPGGR